MVWYWPICEIASSSETISPLTSVSGGLGKKSRSKVRVVDRHHAVVAQDFALGIGYPHRGRVAAQQQLRFADVQRLVTEQFAGRRVEQRAVGAIDLVAAVAGEVSSLRT